MVATQPLPQQDKPDFSDAEREAMALGAEVQAAEGARKDVAKERKGVQDIANLSREEIQDLINSPGLQINVEDRQMMLAKIKDLEGMTEEQRREELDKMNPEDKRLLVKTLRWQTVEDRRIQLLHEELFADLKQAAEGTTPLETEASAELNEEQALQELQKPAVRVTNEDMKRAEELKDIPFDQWSDADKALIPRVQEFMRLVAMLSDENRKKLADEDTERERLLAKAEQEKWFEGMAAEKVGEKPLEMGEEKVA